MKFLTQQPAGYPTSLNSEHQKGFWNNSIDTRAFGNGGDI